MRALITIFIAAMALTQHALAENSSEPIPNEIRSFVDQRTKPITFAEADLNGDGLSDYILVLEKQPEKAGGPEIEEEQRPLKIIIRRPDKSLAVKKVNQKVVLCSTCGGVFGDPFDGIHASKGSFTVSHYGGSAWRWSTMVKFAYSKRDDTWQLVSVEETSFHTSNPDKQKTKRYRPPKDFGKIDIADFEPENFLGVGAK